MPALKKDVQYLHTQLCLLLMMAAMALSAPLVLGGCRAPAYQLL